MNRKKAILSIFVLGGGAVASYSGYWFYNINKTPDFQFLEAHMPLIADLAETIIPRTNSPGAKDVKAEEIIISLIKNGGSRKIQNNFIEGLKDTDQVSMSRYQKLFIDLDLPQQKTVVEHLRDKGKNFLGILGIPRNKVLGKSFFDILKYYSTVAYCTSLQGTTETLAYDCVPGRYNGCVPLGHNQKSWATK